MASNDYTTPDLASVLATLAAYAPPVSSTTQQGQASPDLYMSQAQTNQPHQLEELEDGEYDPADFIPTPNTQATQQTPVKPIQQLQPQSFPLIFSENPQQPLSQRDAKPLSQPTTSIQVSRPPPVDPTTLLTWPSALRHVTKTIAPNPRAMERIRDLITSQHTHERQWWAGRELLIKKQRERGEGRARIDDVLKAVGGKVNNLSSGSTPEDDAKELLIYDKKVHRACTEMFRAIHTELRNLGIPFFGINQNSIIPEKTYHGTESENTVSKQNGKISEEELQALQNRMIELIEDLCKD